MANLLARFGPLLALAEGSTAAPPARRRRRGSPRAAHRLPCRVLILSGEMGITADVVGWTVNVSVGGLAVRTTQPLIRGMGVVVLLPNAAGHFVRVEGRVVHSRRVTTGTYEAGIAVRE